MLDGIEQSNIPAPAPIEQRWSASSASYMSPTYYDGTTNGLYSWMGIINYLPSYSVATTTPEQEFIQRQDTTALFAGPYCDLLRQIVKELDVSSHWAKIKFYYALIRYGVGNWLYHQQFIWYRENTTTHWLDPSSTATATVTKNSRNSSNSNNSTLMEDPLIGCIISKHYHIRSLLGQGVFGKVYSLYDTRTMYYLLVRL